MNMNHNEEVPDFLGGLGDMQPADVLKMVNELLELLHRKDKDHQGSTVFIYAPGSQYVDKQFIIGDRPPATNPVPVYGHLTPHGGRELEKRIRQCIALLMAERFGNEPMFNQQSHWQAVYRILVDKGYCRDSDFDGFDTFIKRVMPDNVNKPYKKDSVKRISQTDFVKPFTKWSFDTETSKTRKPYDRMVAVAVRFLEILEENDL
jgi:hypothetical protein